MADTSNSSKPVKTPRKKQPSKTGPEPPFQEKKVNIEIDKAPRYGPPPQQQPYYYPPGQQPQPYYSQQQQSQPYYYRDPSYNQRQTPAYQQQAYGPGGNYPPPSYGRQGRHQQEDRWSDESFHSFHNQFTTVKLRNQFVRKVYMILTVQLLFSFAIILLVTFMLEARLFVLKNYLILVIVGLVLYFSTCIALVCCESLRRNFPVNFILLGLLTIGMTMSILGLVAVSHPNVLLAAVGTTVLLCSVVSVFAIQTKWDVTGCGMCFCILTVVLMIYGLIITILSFCGIHMEILHVVYSALGVMVFTLWLMYDTQMVIGGRRIELSPEEYIVGALSLYVDMMIIFIHILSLYNHCMGGD